jgi:uncharacterized membrane protein
LLSSASNCNVTSISGDGLTEGGACDITSGEVPVRWTGTSVPVNLGLAVGYVAGGITSLSSNGMALTGATGKSGPNNAGLWRSGTNPTVLNSVSGAVATFGQAISADGSTIVGEVDFATGEYPQPRSFRWTNATGMVLVPLLPGGTQSIGGAKAVSSDGTKVVGHSDATGGRELGYLYNATTGTITALVEPGGTYAFATAISDDGTTVAGYGDSGGWISINGGTPVLISATLAGFGVDLTGMSIDAVFDLSADGKVVTGSVTDTGGSDEGFIAILK